MSGCEHVSVTWRYYAFLVSDWIHFISVCLALLIPTDTLSDPSCFSFITPHRGIRKTKVALTDDSVLGCSSLCRCMLLSDDHSATFTLALQRAEEQTWNRIYWEVECTASQLSFLYYKAPPFLLHSCFQPPSLLFSIPLIPPFFASRQKMWDEALQYTASPKGRWDLYCKDLIDFSPRQDSPSSLTLALAGTLCVSFFLFTHTKTHKVKLCLRESLLALEVIKKKSLWLFIPCYKQ